MAEPAAKTPLPVAWSTKTNTGRGGAGQIPYFPRELTSLALGTAGLGQAWNVGVASGLVGSGLRGAQDCAYALCVLSACLLAAIAVESLLRGRCAPVGVLAHLRSDPSCSAALAVSVMALMIDFGAFALHDGWGADGLGLWGGLWIVAWLAHAVLLACFCGAALRASRANGASCGARLWAVVQQMTHAWVIPPVGFAVATLSGATFTYTDTSGARFVQFLRGAAMWEALVSLLLLIPFLWVKALCMWPAPSMRSAELPPGQLATIAVLIAPHALVLAALHSFFSGGEAWVRDMGSFLFTLSLAALGVLALYAPRIWRETWQPAWACITFPLDILCQGGLLWRAAHVPRDDAGADAWCWVLLLLATAVCGAVWFGALRRVWRLTCGRAGAR